MIDAIANNFKAFSHTDMSKLTLDRLSSHVTKHIPLDDLRSRLERYPNVLKTHSHGRLDNFFIGSSQLSKFIEGLFEDSKIFYIHRDGRDVLTSLYFYVKSFNKNLGEVCFSDFIRMNNDFDHETYIGNLDRISYWLYHVETWLAREDIFLLSFNDLLYDYQNTLRRISQHIGLPLPKTIVNVIRDNAVNTFAERIKRKLHLGIRYSTVYFRKGQSGDWINHFSTEDRIYFEAKAGYMNDKLGYK